MSSMTDALARGDSAARRPGRALAAGTLLARLVAAAILAQTLFFKLTWAPETQVIFADIGGRPAATVAALVELACVVLLLRRATSGVGAALALGTMAGAVATHLFVVGIAVPDPATGGDDGGLLFGLALAVVAASAFVAFVERAQLARLASRFVPR